MSEARVDLWRDILYATLRADRSWRLRPDGTYENIVDWRAGVGASLAWSSP